MERRNMENVLKYINKNFVTVADGDIKDTNPILDKVLDEITIALRGVNVLFNNLFETYLYGGSFFDGLKVSQPDEFDIDLKLFLPKILDVQLEPTDKDGFVFVKLKDWNRLTYDSYLYEIYKDLEKLKDSENYLSQEKVKRWMQGIVQEAINKIRENGKLDDIQLTHRMSGPAVTLNVQYRQHIMDIDLVAVFRIPGHKWPESPVRQNTNRIWQDFLVVPKAPKDIVDHPERYWRLSFPEQEREMIRGLDFCKPALRLLKKLRDTRCHNIPSYFIKTVFLWEIEIRKENNDTAFWRSSLTKVFLHMLETYKAYLDRYEIPYFWNSGNNLLTAVSPINVSNIRDYLNRIIKEIDRTKSEDPYVVAKHLLKENELKQVKKYFDGITPTAIPSPSSFTSNDRTPSWVSEPPRDRSSSGNQTQQTDSFPTAAVVGAAVGIGAAILGGLFAYSRSQRNQNN